VHEVRGMKRRPRPKLLTALVTAARERGVRLRRLLARNRRGWPRPERIVEIDLQTDVGRFRGSDRDPDRALAFAFLRLFQSLGRPSAIDLCVADTTASREPGPNEPKRLEAGDTRSDSAQELAAAMQGDARRAAGVAASPEPELGAPSDGESATRGRSVTPTKRVTGDAQTTPLRRGAKATKLGLAPPTRTSDEGRDAKATKLGLAPPRTSDEGREAELDLAPPTRTSDEAREARRERKKTLLGMAAVEPR